MWNCLNLFILPVTCCTNSLTFNKCTFCPHTVFMCFIFIWEKTATCATYIINWLVFITDMKSVYCAVRNGSLNKAVCHSSFKGLKWSNSYTCHISIKQIIFADYEKFSNIKFQVKVYLAKELVECRQADIETHRQTR
jgi:hypothetical protein